MGVLVIDVDHFKAVNDQHGHLAGDEALMWRAALLRGALPTPTVLARFGGEEFLAVLPRIEKDALLRCAEQVRALVATTSTSRPVKLTVSIGTAIGCVDSQDANEPQGPTFEDLVACADRGVYAAKAGGRNRVNPGSWPTSSATDADIALDTSRDLQRSPKEQTPGAVGGGADIVSERVAEHVAEHVARSRVGSALADRPVRSS